MGRRITITESDYREIIRWEEEGGATADVLYDVIPDRLPNDKHPLKGNSVQHLTRNDRLQIQRQPETKVA